MWSVVFFCWSGTELCFSFDFMFSTNLNEILKTISCDFSEMLQKKILRKKMYFLTHEITCDVAVLHNNKEWPLEFQKWKKQSTWVFFLLQIVTSLINVREKITFCLLHIFVFLFSTVIFSLSVWQHHKHLYIHLVWYINDGFTRNRFLSQLFGKSFWWPLVANTIPLKWKVNVLPHSPYSTQYCLVDDKIATN